MSKIEITEKEHQIYEQNQDLIKKLISGEHNCLVTRVNLDGKESEVLKLNIEKDSAKFQEDYDRLLFKYTETAIQLAESEKNGKISLNNEKLNHGTTILGLQQRESEISKLNDTLDALEGDLSEKGNVIRELKAEVKRLSRRNWFHKLFNL